MLVTELKKRCNAGCARVVTKCNQKNPFKNLLRIYQTHVCRFYTCSNCALLFLPHNAIGTKTMVTKYRFGYNAIQ